MISLKQVQPWVSYIWNILRCIILLLHVALAIPAVNHIQTRQQLEDSLPIILMLVEFVFIEFEDLEMGERSELWEGLRRGDPVISETEEMQQLRVF